MVIFYLFVNNKPKIIEEAKIETDVVDSIPSGPGPELVTQGMTISIAEPDGSIVSPTKSDSFTVHGGNFYLKPNIIKVKEGDTVTITFKNDEGTHDLKIDGYNVSTSRIGKGEEEKVTFKANKKGSFKYYCSIFPHRFMGMNGTLIVE